VSAAPPSTAPSNPSGSPPRPVWRRHRRGADRPWRRLSRIGHLTGTPAPSAVD
jgi:hypothetical protein